MHDLRTTHFNEIRATLTGKRAQVHAALLETGPKTACALALAMGWDKCSVRPRVTELCELGLAELTGRRIDSQHEFRAVSLDEWQRRNAVEARQLQMAI